MNNIVSSSECSAKRQVFHRNLKNQGCSFTRDWIDAVTSRFFPHSILSLAPEQTLEDLKRSQGHKRGGKESGLANWALRISPKFTWELNISSIGVFDQIRDPKMPITLRPIYISSVFCPMPGPSLQTQAPRLQICPKAGLPLHTQEPRLQFY